MDVVYEWCNGSSFMELCKKTDIFEGKSYMYNTFLLTAINAFKLIAMCSHLLDVFIQTLEMCHKREVHSHPVLFQFAVAGICFPRYGWL